jgi:hypothetical protein
MDERAARLRDVLLALPQEELEVRARGGTRLYRGVPLHAYAVGAGLLPDSGDDAIASGYVVVTAADGARAAVAAGEIAPEISDRRILLATEQDGEALHVGVRLVVPGEGGRSLLGVVSVEGRSVEAVRPSTGSGRADGPAGSAVRATAVELSGLLQRPGVVDLLNRDDLVTVQTVPGSSHGQPIAERNYSGVPVHRLLGEAGMYFMTEGEELQSKVVVARGADGHAAVLSAGEFGPHNTSNPAIVAVARDGVPLAAEEGLLRLIVPYDRLSARWVQHLVSLELRDG